MKNKRRFIILIVILFVVAHFTFSAVRPNSKVLLTDRIVVSVYGPVIKFFKNIGGFFADLGSEYLFLVGAKKQNKELVQEVQALRLQNKSLKILLDQKTNHQFLQNKLQFLDKSVLSVDILGFDPFDQSKTILIDAGTNKGIQTNMVVVTGDGLVGRVIQALDKTSKVLLAIDDHFYVDALNERTHMRCLVKGLTNDQLRVKRLPYLTQIEFKEQGHEIETGDVLMTSGLGGIYPQGIPIGTVTDVDFDKKNLFHKSYVLPKVDFMKLKRVYVLADK